MTCKENRKKFRETRTEYNKAEQQAKADHEKKLKEELTDGSLSMKDWCFKVNTLSGRTT